MDKSGLAIFSIAMERAHHRGISQSKQRIWLRGRFWARLIGVFHFPESE
jgi:hypothetical protein